MVVPSSRTLDEKIPGRPIAYFLLQDVKAKESILYTTIPMKLRPTDPLQTTVALLPEEDSPHMIRLVL